MGGAGGRQSITRNSFSVGVDAAQLPQARVFQAAGPTTVKAKKRGARGRYAMFWALLYEFGIAFSDKRLERGFVIQPRRVGINRRMLTRVRAAVRNYLVRGAAAQRKAA